MSNISLHPEHLADLKKSGLNDETIKSMGVYSARPLDIPKLLGFNPSWINSALVIPYPAAQGFSRMKVFPPGKDDEGHTIKYLQAKDSGSHLYILPQVEAILKDTTIPLALAEGEKKAASLIQAGLSTVGIAGIWNWQNGETHQPIEEIDAIAWAERDVDLYFDSDIWHRPDLLKAIFALGAELEERGANVLVVMLKQKNDEKIGIDDFLVTNGLEALKTLKKISLDHSVFTKARKWFKKRHSGKHSSKKSISPAPDNLKGAIYEIRKMSNYEALEFEKKRFIANAVLKRLKEIGIFYITPENNCYYFDKNKKILFPLGSDEFRRFLADMTGVNPSENEFNYLTEDLSTEAWQRGEKTKIHYLSYFEKTSHRVFVTDFGSGMYVLDGTTVKYVFNGEEGILFAPTFLAAPYKHLEKEQRLPGVDVRSFLGLINFDPKNKLSPKESEDLLFFWKLSLFFKEINPTKLIPTFIGSQGSSKTTTARRIGMFFLGERFNVTHLESAERGEQAFIAAICRKAFTAFDNADAPVKWLADRLATYATGQDFELRKLYTTNDLEVHRPVANLMLTSRDPYFRRSDVAERLLVLRLVRPDKEKFIPEEEIIAKTLKERDTVWSDLLDILNACLIALKKEPEAPRLRFRIADFASFGWRISKAFGGQEQADYFCECLKKLDEEQATYTTEEDPTAQCLGTWIEAPGNLERHIDTGELFKELAEIAKKLGLMIPKTSQRLGKDLRLAKRQLETALDIKISLDQTTHTTTWVFSRPTGDLRNSPKNAPPTLPILQKEVLGGQDGEEGKIPENLYESQ